MPRRRTYHQVKDGEWFKPSMVSHWDSCCDCHLTHREQYVVVDKKTGKRIPGAQIMIRSYRHERATAALRRKFNFERDDE